MRKIVWLLLMLFECVWAAKAAANGALAETILYCFSTHLCLQFMKDGANNG
jgi:hypothetical protein